MLIDDNNDTPQAFWDCGGRPTPGTLLLPLLLALPLLLPSIMDPKEGGVWRCVGGGGMPPSTKDKDKDKRQARARVRNYQQGGRGKNRGQGEGGG